MGVRVALTKSQLEAIETPRSAKVLVEGMNREINTQKVEINSLRANYANLQDKHEIMSKKFHKADKKNGVLDATQNTYFLAEIIKYVLTAVGTGYGVNVVTSGENWGWIVVGVSGLAYIALTKWQTKIPND